LAFDIFFDWIPDQVGNDGEVMRFRNRPAASGLFRNDILSVYRLFARPVFDSEVAHFVVTQRNQTQGELAEGFIAYL